MRSRSRLPIVHTICLIGFLALPVPTNAAAPQGSGPTLTPVPLPLNDTGSGITLDWTYTRSGASDLGSSVAPAGDVNGDGYADIVVGAQATNGLASSGGLACVFHGSPTGFPATPDWEMFGEEVSAYFGNQVAGAGDVNGDGYDDVLVTSLYYDTPSFSNAGRVWLFLGSASGLPATADWTADGEQAVALFGSAVSTAGDVNGDGFDDIIVGSFAFDVDPALNRQEGRVYVFHGSSSGPSTTPDWIATGRDFTISWGYGSLGHELSDAGDVNGDGYDDVIVAADYSIAVFLGSATGLEADPSWTNNQLSQIGQDVAGIGDIDGDGYDDIAASTINYSMPEKNEGAVVVFRGGPTGPETAFSWLAEGDGKMAYYGWSVGPAGDVNGDGYADLFVGALFYSNPQMFEGLTHVFHGSPQGLSTVPSWKHETNVANTRFGISAETAGDLDGDGFDDLVVGANTFANPNGTTGRITVFRGGPDQPPRPPRLATSPSQRP